MQLRSEYVCVFTVTPCAHTFYPVPGYQGTGTLLIKKHHNFRSWVPLWPANRITVADDFGSALLSMLLLLTTAFLLLIPRSVGDDPLADEPHRWSYEISSRHGGGAVDNPIQVIELSKRERLGSGVETAHVCISLHGVAGAGGGVREQWMPSCFSVFDGRWARSVVSIGSAKGGTDVEFTGWSAGLASGTGTITWRANTRIGAYVDHTHRNSNADEAAVVSIEQELESFIDAYRAKKYFENGQLFRIVSPKNNHDYPPGTSRLTIETQVVDIPSFSKTVGEDGSVCTSLVHVPSGRLKKACFPIKENNLVQTTNTNGKVAFAWAKDYADLGSLTGEFVFRIFAIAYDGGQVNKGARSRFTVLPVPDRS